MRRSYGGLAMLLALIPAATIAVPAVSSPTGRDAGQTAIPVADPSQYDTFGAATVNAVIGGAEQPLTTAGDWSTGTFATTSFTIQTSPVPENGSSPNYNGCLTAPGEADFAGRTAWVRINPGVDGKVAIVATTAYDAVLNLFKATNAPHGSATFANILNSDWCSSRFGAGAAESIGFCAAGACHPVDSAFDYYVQVGVKCPDGPSTCLESNMDLAPGGDTIVQVKFVPDDADGDGVPDTTDVCPAVSGQAGAQGCPDADGDGIRDDNGADDCPSLAGVPASPPYNGCPAGPTPPAPEVYLRISSLSGNEDNTNSVQVTLRLSWPQGAQKMTIDNGDGVFATFDVVAEKAWTLRPLTGSAASEARQVNVTYKGPGIPEAYRTDTITLDTVKPVVPEGEFSKMGVQGWHFFVRAVDNGTGVRRIQMLDRQRKVLRTKTFCDKSCDSAERIGLYSPKAKPLYARITDLAGNKRVVRLARSLAACDVPPYKVYRVNSTKSRCFSLKETCVRDPWDWKHADIPLACRKVNGVFRVQRR